MPELKKEQLEVVNFDKGNILVSASAGSGKTFVMIERVIKLITEKKAGVKELLAMTFTESAASDMKEKLKEALTKKVLETNSKELSRELEEVGTADISTLHSFCGRLIRQYFFAADVSPDFKIIDEGQANKLKKESIDQTFRELYEICYKEKREKNTGDLERVSDWFLNLIDIYSTKRSDSELKEQVLSVYEYVWSDAYPESMLSFHEKVYSKQGLELIRAEYKIILDTYLINAIYSLKEILDCFESAGYLVAAKYLEGLIGDYKAILDSDLYAVKDLIKNKRTLSFDKKLPEEYLEKKETVKKIRSHIDKALSRYDQILISKDHDDKEALYLYLFTEHFCRLVRKFAQIYAEKKREENLLDFSDLEHFALKVLEDPTVIEAVRARYKYVFVDEYQDVNGVQEEIINKISNDNLFMVGDIKQSIYGFRGCRPDFFKQKFEKMQKEGQKTVLLNHNFRSADAVINMVNDIFSYSYTEENSGLSYAKTSTLKSGGLYKDNFGRAKLHFLQKDARKESVKEQPRIYDVLDSATSEEEEISSLASLITDIIQKECQNTYYDIKEDKMKNITYGDIAILSRRGASDYVAKVVRGLMKHKIPVGSLVNDNVCTYPEVIMMIETLKLIDNFYQDVPLASVLKSPIGKFTDEDLCDIAIFYRDSGNYGGFSEAFNYYLSNAQTPLKDKLLEFKAYFDKIRYLADFLGAHGILNKIIEDNDVYPFLLAQADGEKKQNRIMRFMSESVVDGKNLTVSEFLDRIENSPESFDLLEYAEENAVKVMTIHASKGLEFPVTIVFGLEKTAESKENSAEIMLDRDYGIAVKSYDNHDRSSRETLLRGLIRERNVVTRMNEELRLFYVATTRAKYSLHLIANTSKDVREDKFIWANKFIDYIPKKVECEWRSSEEFDFINTKVGPRQVLIGKHDQETLEKMKTNYARVYEFNYDTLLPLKSSVTSTLKNNPEDPPVKVVFTDGETNADKGVVAHKILELYDFNLGLDLAEHANNLVINGEITKEQLDKVDLSRISLGIQNIIGEIKGKTTYPEKSFLVNIPSKMLFDVNSSEEVLVQGIIDLLVIGKDNTAQIVDYKYSSLSLESLKEKYKKQLDLYAYAVERVLGLKVTGKTLLNVYSGESVKIS